MSSFELTKMHSEDLKKKISSEIEEIHRISIKLGGYNGNSRLLC